MDSFSQDLKQKYNHNKGQNRNHNKKEIVVTRIKLKSVPRLAYGYNDSPAHRKEQNSNPSTPQE